MARPTPVAPELRDWLRAEVEASSVRIVAQRLDVSDATITRALADLPIQTGTCRLLELAREKQAGEPKA